VLHWVFNSLRRIVLVGVALNIHGTFCQIQLCRRNQLELNFFKVSPRFIFTLPTFHLRCLFIKSSVHLVLIKDITILNWHFFVYIVPLRSIWTSKIFRLLFFVLTCLLCMLFFAFFDLMMIFFLLLNLEWLLLIFHIRGLWSLIMITHLICLLLESSNLLYYYSWFW